MRGKANQFGITLLELIVAIAILGILASIGIPMLTGNIRTAKYAEIHLLDGEELFCRKLLLFRQFS